MHDVAKRDGWNEPATGDYALPTETWREHVARRRHYEEVFAKLTAGKVTAINDLITYNLDIERFAQDVISGSEGPELVRAFWKAISAVSILDPTCGSGAFLFAALNILEPIYTACLEAMRGLLDDLKRSQRKHRPEKMSDFRKTLKQVDSHPSERYYILKSIIINNLYGVDIMEEAVEICKLRLFLKLVAQLESYEQIEPLPDIDFNVRAGNTLVGFTSLDDVRRAVRGDLFKEQSLPEIEERAESADRAFRLFQEMQTDHKMDASAFGKAKLDLKRRLDDLRDRLDRYLAGEYGVQDTEATAYEGWRARHQPFHWFVEFYGIIQKGGFNVVIGNPPYVATKKVLKNYKIRNLETRSCSDIYACVLERSESLLKANGRSGMIVPLSLGFSSDFDVCRRLLYEKYDYNWFSSFGRIPSALFSFDVRVRNIVHLGHASNSRCTSSAFTTRLHRWFENARPTLFHTIEFVPFQPSVWKYRVPKLNSQSVSVVFETILRRKKTFQALMRSKPTKYALHFKQTAYNWLAFSRNVPPASINGRPVSQTGIGEIYFPDEKSRELGMLLANGKLMFIFWLIVGDDFHVTRWNVAEFPCDLSSLPTATVETLRNEMENLERAMRSALQFKLNAGRRVGNYNLAKCRHVTDRVDALVAKALGFEDALEDMDLYYIQSVKTHFRES